MIPVYLYCCCEHAGGSRKLRLKAARQQSPLKSGVTHRFRFITVSVPLAPPFQGQGRSNNPRSWRDAALAGRAGMTLSTSGVF